MMRRIDDGMDLCDLERLSTECSMGLIWRRARCMHGKTNDQTCASCEGGYVTDTHRFANVSHEVWQYQGVAAIAVSDDGDWVAYVPDPAKE